MELLPSSSYVSSTIWLHHIDAVKAYREKAKRVLHAMSYIEQFQEATSYEAAALQLPTSYL